MYIRGDIQERDNRSSFTDMVAGKHFITKQDVRNIF